MLLRIPLVLLSLLAPSSLADNSSEAPTRVNRDSTPFNTANPASTPRYRPHNISRLVEIGSISQHWGALSSQRSPNSSQRRSTVPLSCLDSTATDVTINTLLSHGGVGAIVSLCPGATIALQNSIIFTSSNQSISTMGPFTQETRAILKVTGSKLSTAIVSTSESSKGNTIRDLVVDGSRRTLGILVGGNALIELGGNAPGVTINNVKAFDTRGWSTIHVIEGYANSCRDAVVTNNQISDAGNAPNNGAQFRKRATPVYTPGQWADGISLSCRNSIVTGNTITDATDGSLVIFGSPGSLISGNTITTINRNSLGAINAVDYMPWAGDMRGVRVTNNVINARSSMIKIGIAVGVLIWSNANAVTNSTKGRNHGAVFEGNTLTSSNPDGSIGIGYFGYAIAVSGNDNSTVLTNSISHVNIGGDFTSVCAAGIAPPSVLVKDPYTTSASEFAKEFRDGLLSLSICLQEGPITMNDVTYDNTRGVEPNTPLSPIPSSTSLPTIPLAGPLLPLADTASVVPAVVATPSSAILSNPSALLSFSTKLVVQKSVFLSAVVGTFFAFMW